MSPKTNPDFKSSPVFYLNEDKTDFTFYLDATHNQDVFQALAKCSSDDAEENKKSLAPEISFTNVLFKTGTVDKIASKFWERLRAGGPAFDYLLEKMKRRRPAGRVIYTKVKAAKTLSPAEREQFRQLINNLLSSTAFDDLSSQSWITSTSKSLSKEDEQLLNDLKRHRRSYSEQYKRFLMAAVFPGLFTWKTDRGRALICFSHAGRYLSVTVRKQKEEATGYQADFHKKTEERRKYLFSTGEYCHQLYHEFFETTNPPQPARGLLVVTGATNSLKSEIARGLIDMYLRNKERGPKERLHHLVTFEDPIEKFYYVEKTKGPARVALVPSKRVRDIDYTPRQKLQDASDLQRALNDALRQTPTVFFVGETRIKEEWPVLLDFAATGHFIVTTAHAGSLVEAMHKIFEACHVHTSGDRAEIASKLLGLIHLRPWNVLCGGGNAGDKSKVERAGVLLPAIWRRTGSGVAALTSNGLASLLPEQQAPEKTPRGLTSCLGRRWFIEALIRQAESELKKAFGDRLTNSTRDNRSIDSQLKKRAREWDLQGV